MKTKKKVEIKIDKKPLPYEPKMGNRFILTFPKHFNINDWQVQNVYLPTYRSSINPFKNKWSDLEVEFIDIVPINLNKLFLNQKDTKDFNIKVTMLDPTGVEVETFMVEIKKISQIFLGRLSYSDTNIKKIFVNFKVKDVKIVY